MSEKTYKNLESEDTNMASKHYTRLKGFITYDIEERSLQEQKIILEQTIKACTDMLKELNNK